MLLPLRLPHVNQGAGTQAPYEEDEGLVTRSVRVEALLFASRSALLGLRQMSVPLRFEHADESGDGILDIEASLGLCRVQRGTSRELRTFLASFRAADLTHGKASGCGPLGKRYMPCVSDCLTCTRARLLVPDRSFAKSWRTRPFGHGWQHRTFT